MESAVNRPRLLTPFVIIIFLMDLFSYTDYQRMDVTEIIGTILLSLVTLPFYWGLYRGKDWARWTIAILLLFTIIMLGGAYISGDGSAMVTWQKVLYSFETLFSLIFIGWTFLPKVSRYFRENTEKITLGIVPTPIMRKFLSFIFDLFISAVIFIVLERVFFRPGNSPLVALSCGLIGFLYFVLTNWKNVGIGQLLFKTKIVSFDGGQVPLWKHFLRPFYAFLFFFISGGLAIADLHRRGVHDHIFKTIVVNK